jgi:hypothetical protein
MERHTPTHPSMAAGDADVEEPSQLTTLARDWQDRLEPELFATWMASSEVDQKFLGHFAKTTSHDNPYLSAMLYKVLGLSVILAKKLVRARRLRRLDPTRDTKSLELYHHIIWLSREGLVIVEQYVLPMVEVYAELRVLAYKLRASFYHIFVLFHNQPSINQASIPSFKTTTPETPLNGKGKTVNRDSLGTSPTRHAAEGGPVGPLPPGLAPVSVPKPAASFLLPAVDYIPTATQCFTAASTLADHLLSGSHPIRLSVKLEYAAFLYDCLHDGEGSRRLAKQTIREVYDADEDMDDETFEDAAELVGILGKMMRRGLSGGTTTPGVGSEGSRSTPRAGAQGRGGGGGGGLPPAELSPGMSNPI